MDFHMALADEDPHTLSCRVHSGLKLISPIEEEFNRLVATLSINWPKSFATAEKKWAVESRCAKCSLKSHYEVHIYDDGSYINKKLSKYVKCTKIYNFQFA
jgi:hypothetical protein